MIIGLGIDVVHVSRLEHWKDVPGLHERFFHPEELSDARSRGTGFAVSLAARFAAKEAFGKALGTGLTGISLKDMKVRNDRNGKPELFLSGRARERFTALGGKRIHISLTHERDAAIAVVVIEGE